MTAEHKPSSVDAPHFLIVVPTINRNELLNETLASIFGQRYPHWTVLVSDNESTVPVANTIPAEFTSDPRFRLVRRSRLSTGTEHIEVLMRESLALDYDYAVFLADDDLFLPQTLTNIAGASMGAGVITTAYATWYVRARSISYPPTGAPYRVKAVDEILRLAALAGANVVIPPGDPRPQLGPNHLSTYFFSKTVLQKAISRYAQIMEAPFGDVGYGKLAVEAGNILYLSEPLAIIRMGANYGMVGAQGGQRHRLIEHHGIPIQRSPLRAVTFANMSLESYLGLLFSLGIKVGRGVSPMFLRRHALEILCDRPWGIGTLRDLAEVALVSIIYFSLRGLITGLRRLLHGKSGSAPFTVAEIPNAASAIAYLSKG